MPVLTNARYERFAQNLATGIPQHEAYTKAGFILKPSGHRTDASKLARKPEIADRVKELLERQAKRLDITVDTLVGELDLMYKLALATKQPGAGIGAIMGKAKLLGLVVDKAEVESSTVRRPMRTPGTDKKMSMDEWQKKFARPDGGPLQ
jgi:phage terminase small subunit